MTVLVAMSGGVDSSVAAAMLLDAGHDVVGVTMKLWGGASDTGCCSVSDTDDARRVCQQLGIDHHVFNFSSEFDEHVVEPYVDAHRRGLTPNPCIECNRHLKFDRLLRRADELGISTVATGHHARIVTDDDGIHRVARGADAAKDQSYVLHMLGQPELGRILFPLGGSTKSEVREIAGRRGLRTAGKAESQDVCFITRADGREQFLADRITLHPAEVRDPDGRTVGRVDAVEAVTLGQRRGVGAGGGTSRRYVTAVDVPGRSVTVGPRSDLLVDRCQVASMSWADRPHMGPVSVQTSAHGAVRGAEVTRADDRSVELRWAEPTHVVSPGQSVVLYLDDVVVGGGVAVSDDR